MEKSINMLEGTDISINGLSIKIKGPLGEISKSFDDPRYSDIIIKKDDGKITVYQNDENRKTRSMIGTIAAHIRNMMHGVTKGYTYEMKIVYKHFPMTVAVKEGQKDAHGVADCSVQVKNFLGEKSIREVAVIGKSAVKIDKESIIVTGIDIEEVGQTAANIERACKLRGRDRRVFQDGIFITSRHTSKGVVKG